MTRRTFLGTAGLGAIGFCLHARPAAATESSTGTILMPSEFFGAVTPIQAGLREEVTSKMSAYLQSQVDSAEIPGAYVAATRHGKVFLEQHFGTFCDRTRRDAPYDGVAIHPFQSISKMVSATAVTMAWQDGLIDIDVPVMKYIPEFCNGGKEVITIRQLLTHSAGIPNTPKGIRAGTEEQWRAAVAAVCAEPTQWVPGSRTEYHGLTGMLIAAEVVRRVSDGKSWEQICQERVFTPLGLTTFTFEEPLPNLPLACIPRLPDPPAQWQAEIDRAKGEPAAGLKGGFTDVLQLLAFHSQRGIWKGRPLLQEKYWAEMHKPQFDDRPRKPDGKPAFDSWGLGMIVRGMGPQSGSQGWFGIRDVKGPHVFSHVGTDTAMAVGDPDTNTQIAFIITDTPKSAQKAVELRNTVTNIVFNALV